MIVDEPLDPVRVARLAQLTLLEREELAILIGEATLEFWIRGMAFDGTVEACLEATIGDSPNGAVRMTTSADPLP